MATAIFPAHRAGQTQREAVREHVALLKDRLKPYGVPVTFDIFGLTASVTSGDLGIGQVWEDFVSVADVVLPMVYPKRSEEHTSELQSRLHLVCRLLLEKKKRTGRRRSH